MALPEHLIIKTEGLPMESLLSDWRWLVMPNLKPVLMTSFGDLFLCDEAGHIHFLDLMSGELKQVAETQDEFALLCKDAEHRCNWFVGTLLMELRNLLGNLATGECYSCKIPLSLGGQLEPDNFERVDLNVHYSILGQIHRQTKHLPPGTKIGKIKADSPNAAKPESWWKKLFILL